MESPWTIATDKKLLERLTPLHLFWGLSIVSLTIMLISTCALYSSQGALPPPRKPPPIVEKTSLTSFRFKEGFYRSLVEEDAKKVGLNISDTKPIWGPNLYSLEFSGAQKLKDGGVLETTHLKLKVVTSKIWVGEEGQGFRTEHLMLHIINKTDKYLAYRVLTEISGKCKGKGIVPHNSIAIKPGEQIERTECLFTSSPLTIKKVEVLEISSLGYYYVSRLEPQGLQFDQRTSEGHQVTGGFPPCKLIPWREIAYAIERGESKWFDVLDFYSRHNCDEYTFFTAYHWSEVAPPRLPIAPPSAKE